jgi:hypothetical protein
MRDTLKDGMSELIQFAHNKPNKVMVRKYTLNNLPEYNPSAVITIRNKTQMNRQNDSNETSLCYSPKGLKTSKHNLNI